jgi:hypothetical protein
MGEAFSTHGRDEKFMQNVGWETLRAETSFEN